jgi:hypothetical protein
MENKSFNLPDPIKIEGETTDDQILLENTPSFPKE